MTRSGLDKILDRDGDSSVDSDMTTAVADAIRFASDELESALQGVFGLAYLRQLDGNTILRDIAAPIAIEQLAGIGGANISDQVYLEAKRARERLAGYAGRTKLLPGVTYPTGSTAIPVWPRENAGRIVCDEHQPFDHRAGRYR